MDTSIIKEFIQGDYTVSYFLKMGIIGEDIEFTFAKGYIGKSKNSRTIGIEIVDKNDIRITDVNTCTSVPVSNFNLFLMDEDLFFGGMEDFKNKHFKKLEKKGYFKKLLNE